LAQPRISSDWTHSAASSQELHDRLVLDIDAEMLRKIAAARSVSPARQASGKRAKGKGLLITRHDAPVGS